MNDRKPVVPINTEQTLPPLTDEEQAVIETLRGLQFGTIEIVVHQSRIMQVVRSERMRFADR